MISRLEDLGALYQDYGYAYPHKSAYRSLEPPVPLEEAWAGEDRQRLQMYVHLPFCEMRCGFCNLFTAALPKQGRVDAFLKGLRREMRAAKDAIGPVRPQRLILGGGTPTFIGAPALNALLEDIGAQFGFDAGQAQAAIETSPKTTTREMVDALNAWGFERISLGVQSFIEAESHSLGRPQAVHEVESALDLIRERTNARLNIDLIYGAEGQTVASFEHSLQRALHWSPDEIYLYPLYVRPGVGLARRRENMKKPDISLTQFNEHRRALYRHGREVLLAAGYEQVSMRAFRKPSARAAVSDEYSCQEDGLIGLGAGARSYTAGLHYSAEYAVSRGGVQTILDAYSVRSEAEFSKAHYGMKISAAERKCRYVLKSILRQPGLDLARYRQFFGAEAVAEFEILPQLERLGCLARLGDMLAPTPLGLEYSDALPPHFYSGAVRRRMIEAVLT